MIPLAQKPSAGFARPERPTVVVQMGQNAQQPLGWGWTPVVNVTSVGGLLLSSGAISSMFVSTDKRLGQQICRALAAAFGVFLVAKETWHPSRSLSESITGTFVAPSLLIAAVIAALSGVGYLAFKKK